MSRIGGRREGWGSAEATEMVLNNLFYITAKVMNFKQEVMWCANKINGLEAKGYK